MKIRSALTALAVVMMLHAAPSRAGIPVFDEVANTVNARQWAEKLQQWEQTAIHYKDQMNAYKEQLAAQTGIRDVQAYLSQAKGLVTEATQLAALVRVADFVVDPRIKKLLKEKDKDKKDEHGGIGTPATRAGIIETLKTRDYITVEKGKFIPTAAGLALIDALPGSVTQPDMTAVWAEKQAAVETGEMTIERFIEGLYAEVSRLVESADIALSATENKPAKTALNRLAVNCPSCGAELVMTPKTCACTGCQFKVWLEVRGKKLTEKQAETLISKGKTGVIKGFKSTKNDDTYSMIVTLKNPQTGETGFEYPPREDKKPTAKQMPRELKL